MVAETPLGVDGILLEQVHHSGREHRLLRGWFRLHTGGPDEVHLAPRGRWVQVANSNADGTATLTLKPPAWWRHPPYPWASLHLQGTEPQPLWIPDEAVAILVDGEHPIPVAGIGDKLVVD